MRSPVARHQPPLTRESPLWGTNSNCFDVPERRSEVAVIRAAISRTEHELHAACPTAVKARVIEVMVQAHRCVEIQRIPLTSFVLPQPLHWPVARAMYPSIFRALFTVLTALPGSLCLRAKHPSQSGSGACRKASRSATRTSSRFIGHSPSPLYGRDF